MTVIRRKPVVARWNRVVLTIRKRGLDDGREPRHNPASVGSPTFIGLNLALVPELEHMCGSTGSLRFSNSCTKQLLLSNRSNRIRCWSFRRRVPIESVPVVLSEAGDSSPGSLKISQKRRFGVAEKFSRHPVDRGGDDDNIRLPSRG